MLHFLEVQRLFANRSLSKFIFCSVDIKHWGDFYEEPPPGPLPDTHKFSYIFLDASQSNILNLEKKNFHERHSFHCH